MNQETEQDQAFVEYVVKSIVDHPEEVRTDRTVDEMGVLITLHLDPEDMGQVIGRQGQTAKAIRTLLRVVGAKHKSRVNLKIDEPEGSQHRMRASESENHVEHHADAAPSQPEHEHKSIVDSLDSFDAIDDFKL